jgi:hypothetical protein
MAPAICLPRCTHERHAHRRADDFGAVIRKDDDNAAARCRAAHPKMH